MKRSSIFSIFILLLISRSLASTTRDNPTSNSFNNNNQNSDNESSQQPVGDDLSGIIEEFSVYQDQKLSPIEETPTLQDMQEGISEYGFSFWFKLDYLWKEDTKFEFESQKIISLGYIYESDQNALALSLYLQQRTSEYYTLVLRYYDENIGSIYEQNYVFDQLNFDGQWVYLYVSYSQIQEQIDLGLFLPQQNLELYSTHVSDVQHRDLTSLNKPIFRLGNAEDHQVKEGFHGQFRDVEFHYGVTGSGAYKNHDALASSFPDLNTNGYKVNPQSEIIDLSLSQDDNQNQIDRLKVINQDISVRVNNVQYINQYAVEGYFKVSSELVLDNEYRLVYKVSTKNSAKAGSLQNLGDITLYAEINAYGIKFTTYNVHDFTNIVQTTETIPLTIDQYQNFIYVYQGYTAQGRAVKTYIKTYDSTSGQYFHHPSSSQEILHMKSNDYIVTLAKDPHHSLRLRSEFSCFNFRTEDYANQVLSESDIQGLENQSCRQEGFIPNLELNYKLKSYSDQTRFLSYGNPTFLTDDRLGRFQIVQGLIGDVNTVSLKSIQTIKGETRDQFYWRHDGFHVREMQDDGTNIFRKEASYIAHQDLFFPGTIVLESVSKRGYYISVQNFAIVLQRDDGSESLRQNVSWILEEYPLQQLPDLALLPIWRLYNSQTGDSVLTISDEKVQALQQEGYELKPLTFGSSFVQVQESQYGEAIFGYGYNQVRDSHSSALFEFVNPETNTHFYSTDPNGAPPGFQVNQVVAYVYSVNYERTVPAYQFTKQSNPGYGLSYWTTSEQEYQEMINNSDFNYNVQTFWVINSESDPCLIDINQCGPAIPDPCEFKYQYREVQESECIECDGYINHYQGDVVSRKYTAVCEWCVGGWIQDSEGVRTCRTCDDGYWVDLGDRYQICYPHCDIANNYYLNTNNLLCVQCPGELIPDPHIQHLHSCQTCEMGTDIELTCLSQNGNNRVVYEPEACASNESLIRRRQVCAYCEFGSWTRNSDDGQLYCIKVCTNPNDYVDENNQCRPCDFGYIYDDGTGTKRCAEHVREGPFITSQTTENAFSYSVPSEQLDDISELGFFFWFKGSYLTPNYINHHLIRTENARIGGFHLGTVTETRTRQVHVGTREYWENMYSRNELLHYFPFTSNLQDKLTQNYMEENGAHIATGSDSVRDGDRRPGSLYVWNDSPRFVSSLLNGRTQWTVAFWVKIWSGRDDDQSLFSAYSNGNLQLSLNTQSIWYEGSNQYQANYMVGKTNTWHHVVYGRYSTYIDMFINGELIADAHYDSSATLYTDEFKLGIGDKANCDAWISDLTIFSTGDTSIDNQQFQHDSSWFREGVEDVYETETYQVDVAKTLETQLNKHDTETQNHEIINFYGNGGAQSSINYPERKDFDNSWNLVYVSQNSDGQAIGYTYFSHSEQHTAVEFESQSDFSEINFYLGQFNGLENVAQSFQGQFYNVELRFGSTGVFHSSTSDIQTYLHQQSSGINQLPPLIHYTNLISIFEQNTIIDLSQLSNEEKTFTYDNLGATQDYAVYGWFKEHDSFQQTINRALFNLKDLESSSHDTLWRTSSTAGDRALFAFYSCTNNLEFDTYSHSPTFSGSQNEGVINAEVPYLPKDLKQWFFVYAAYSRQTNKAWTYVKELIHGDEYSNAFDYDRDYWHIRPDKQVLNVGYYPSNDLNQNQYTSFNGEVYNLRVQYGTVCQPDNYSCLRSKLGNIPSPDPKGQCVILYTLPNFQGDFVAVCDNNPDFTMVVQSIYVPEGVKFRLYDSIHFQGLSVLYTQSFENISSIDFSLLLLDQVSGAEIIKNDKYYKYIQKQQKKENKNFLAVNVEDGKNNSIKDTITQEDKTQQKGQDNKFDSFSTQQQDKDQTISQNTDNNYTNSSNDEDKKKKQQKKDHLRANAFNKRR